MTHLGHGAFLRVIVELVPLVRSGRKDIHKAAKFGGSKYNNNYYS